MRGKLKSPPSTFFRSKSIDLQNETDVKENFNLTVSDIWREFFWITHIPPYRLTRCASISAPYPYGIVTDTKQPDTTSVRIEH